ncbi:MAG: dihydrofolate reductase family protein [Pseudomonadota bacterium]
MRPRFTLTVATSSDGYIARRPDEPPQAWASAEEQALFFQDVEATDWAIMGRNTHEAADRPDRRRIVFSTTVRGFRRPTQLWLDPTMLDPADLARDVAHLRPLHHGLILGGTRVHDWFLDRQAIHKVHLTIEPIAFGDGLPVFSDQVSRDPVTVFAKAGFEISSETSLNSVGTRYIVLYPQAGGSVSG